MPDTWVYEKRKRKREPHSADEVRRLEVPNRDYTVVNLSPALRRTTSGFGQADSSGLMRSQSEGGLATKVSQSSIPRAIWPWDQLIGRLPGIGISLSGNSSITDGVETVSIEFRELCSSYRDPSKPRRRLISIHGDDSPPRESAPTGVLQFRCEEVYGGGATHQWQETKGTRMEDRLDDVATGVLVLLQTKHERELERIRIEHERAEQARSCEARRRAVEYERARVRKLIRLSKALERSVAIRPLVSALKSRERSETDDFSKWATMVADRLDPVDNIRQSLSEGTDPVKPDAEDFGYR
ncbi:MAG: hypothetical protein M9921_13085 [Fimbriimonadaceae bacterium]|nr:hypothetical protein [Fimbriimonadaceae bacterium]